MGDDRRPLTNYSYEFGYIDPAYAQLLEEEIEPVEEVLERLTRADWQWIAEDPDLDPLES